MHCWSPLLGASPLCYLFCSAFTLHVCFKFLHWFKVLHCCFLKSCIDSALHLLSFCCFSRFSENDFMAIFLLASLPSHINAKTYTFPRISLLCFSTPQNPLPNPHWGHPSHSAPSIIFLLLISVKVASTWLSTSIAAEKPPCAAS